MQPIGVYFLPSWKQLAAASLLMAFAFGSTERLSAQSLNPPAPTATASQVIGSSGQPIQLEQITVVGQLDQARQEIVPNLGATVYTIDQSQINDLPQGSNIPFDKLVLRFPGVTQDSAASGGFHVRDEHGNVQYRINDVLIPEGITGFGNDFDTRFADKVDLITGALPAQYGFRTSAILDIHTKSGAFDEGGNVEMYGGSHEEIRPSFEYGGSQGKWNCYFSGSYLQDTLGIENPTPSTHAIHDDTDQYRGFVYLSYLIDDSSRLSLIAGEAYNQFQIPNSPNQTVGQDQADPSNNLVIPGVSSFDSSTLNEQQREQNNYEVLAYQKTLDDFSFQLALFNRYSTVSFQPDATGDLYFNGVAGQLDRSVMSNGLQFDGSYELNESHTLRGGVLLNAQGALQTADTTVIPLNVDGTQAGAPFSVFNRDYQTAYSYGLYLQDEWKVTRALTFNFGGRFDIYQSSQIRQNQISPRINAVYEIDKATTVHAGYASYFTPPPLENVPGGSVTSFVSTTNAATPGLPNDPVQAERSQYFDAGILHHFTPDYQVGLDGYFKIAKNLIDDGQFGTAPILSAFNYQSGQIAGVELSQSYAKDGFSAYGNIAMEMGIGSGFNSAQSVLFNQADYNYVQNHYIYLDHNQSFTGSFGLSYLINETRPYVEMVCGSGLRTDIDGVPNGGSLHAYDSVNLGFEQTFKFAHMNNLSARFDVVNVFDQIYELRDGSGIGVGAAQFGQRRGFYGGIKYSF